VQSFIRYVMCTDIDLLHTEMKPNSRTSALEYTKIFYCYFLLRIFWLQADIYLFIYLFIYDFP